MNWALLLELIADELGPEAAIRVDGRARAELAGLRLQILPRPVLTPDHLALTNQARPKEAAKWLGAHVSTIYRRRQRGGCIR
jgi:hypothetical protein